MKTIYLHGFASSPLSGKAQYFKRRFAELGIEMLIPVLDGGDFSHLTLTSQLRILETEAAGEPVRLLGSSMGGYLAALYASVHPETERVVLMAPAFCFGSRWGSELGAARVDAWKRDGVMKFFHYGFNEERDLHYELLADAARYPDYPEFPQPTLILHGRNDDVVPVGLSETFAASRSNARLIVLESGHQLTDVTETLWLEARAFLSL